MLPLKFIVRKSCAAMKVGVDHPDWNADLALRIVRDQEEGEDLEEVDVILHDPMDDWRAHTEKTISFLNQMDLQ